MPRIPLAFCPAHGEDVPQSDEKRGDSRLGSGSCRPAVAVGLGRRRGQLTQIALRPLALRAFPVPLDRTTLWFQEMSQQRNVRDIGIHTGDSTPIMIKLYGKFSWPLNDSRNLEAQLVWDNEELISVPRKNVEKSIQGNASVGAFPTSRKG